MSKQPPQSYNPSQQNPYPNAPVPISYGQLQGMYMVQPGAAPVPPGAAVIWAELPQPIPGVPPGLEYLTQVDTMVIQQCFEVLELLTSWESKNKYSLKNANGQQVYYAAEESECCERQCCGSKRSFTIHIVDNFKREVITLHRPFKCCSNAFSCLASAIEWCADECTIESPPGNLIGKIVQRATCCSTGFYVRDISGQEVFRIEGPCCCLLLGCQDKEFNIQSMNGHEVGAITKKWGGCFREAMTDADVFNVNFPMDLDVRMKALLLGATFLIDFVLFEKNNGNSNNFYYSSALLSAF